ncbi:NADP-dependent oxidoreductase [Sciscionella marina]|uniref:NADP-dependent oxidoreductase n=1 Tax=Sciscionella marina TaxID=508770 RepID=UPI000381C01C|nr:NADP-dependent oxidoreductase [Sciscionella marina]
MTENAREFHLASRPSGWPKLENVTLVETPLPGLEDGQILVRNEFISLDPAMRGWMNEGRSYAPPFQVGKAMWGGAVGEVLESRSEKFAAGDHVLHGLGWRDKAIVSAGSARTIDTAAAPSSAYLGVLGMPGMTAYVGLIRMAEFKKGDVVFVSGAAGAVGSLAGQLAKQFGASKVIGSAGSAEKVRYLKEEVGFDEAFNYKDAPVAESLRAAAPDGIDVYFDNVGGDHLEAALFAMNDFGRIAACGAISQYNNEKPEPGPRNLFFIVSKRVAIRGFIVSDNYDMAGQFTKEVAPLVVNGSVSYRETIVDGLENTPQAFIDLLSGANTGKMLVRL